eukprot:GAHX01002220.1.p1 GENE.GAHX01002220.1~~GAHX01002220.1.p1  ORF type:complete len:326 (-),score=48.37 GAHX01002220.1:24-1001(-)
MFTTVFIAIIILNVTSNQSERRVLAPETFTRSYFCLSVVPNRLLQTPVQKENQNSTFEIILVQLSFQQFYNLYKIDVDNFTFYSITFEVDDVFRYTMPTISHKSALEALLTNKTIQNFTTNAEMHKFLYKGDNLEIHEQIYKTSLESGHSNKIKAVYHPFHIWLRSDDNELSYITKRELYLTITKNKEQNPNELSLFYLNKRCNKYKETKHKDIQTKMEELTYKLDDEGLTGLIFQTYFDKAFNGSQNLFLLDPSYFFQEFEHFSLGKYTSLDLPGEEINMETVKQFSKIYVKIKTDHRRKCYVILGGLITLTIIVVTTLVVLNK